MISQDFLALSPLVLLVCGIALVLALSIFAGPVPAQGSDASKPWRTNSLAQLVTLFCLVLGLQMVLPSAGFQMGKSLSTLWSLDTLSVAAVFSLMLIGTLVGLLTFPQLARFGISKEKEYYVLYLLSLCGALIMVSADDFLLIFLGLELLSLPLYILCGIRLPVGSGDEIHGDLVATRSNEASLKYFCLGAVSAAFFLYGVSLIYGASGTTRLSLISVTVGQAAPTLVSLGIGLIVVALGFKIAAVPFHAWSPDAYQGAPLPVTAFMALASKVAGFALIARVLWHAFPHQQAFWAPLVWVLAIISMCYGNLLALRQQQSLKRFYACSSICQGGYLLLGFLVPSSEGLNAIAFFLGVYVVASLGYFACLQALEEVGPIGVDKDHVAILDGLGTRSAGIALSLAIFMLALSGLPPVVAGFLSKFYVFQGVYNAGYSGAVIIALLNSTFACAYYLAIVARMYKAVPDGAAQSFQKRASLSTRLILAACVLGIIVFSVFPGLLMRAFFGISS